MFQTISVALSWLGSHRIVAYCIFVCMFFGAWPLLKLLWEEPTQKEPKKRTVGDVAGLIATVVFINFPAAIFVGFVIGVIFFECAETESRLDVFH